MDKQLGLIVDSVSEVLRIPVADIADPPVEVVGDEADFVTGIAEVGDRLVIILELQKILRSQELQSIAKIKQVIQGSQEVAEDNGLSEAEDKDLSVAEDSGLSEAKEE